MPLIRWWKLDNNAYDSSPTRDNGDVTDLTYTDAGIIGKAGNFTGDRETYIDVTSTTLTTHHTIAFWMYCNTSSPGGATGGMIMGTFNHTANWMYAADSLRFRINENGTSRTWNNTNDVDYYHKWKHVAIVFGETTINLYIDGVSQTSNPQDYNGIFIIDNIGAPYTTNGYDYNGYLNDIRIYDHKLSIKEIKALAQCQLVHYRFSEDRGSSGLIVTDSSDYGNHADVWTSDIATWGNTVPGQGVGYYTFDSTDRIPLTPNFDNRAAADTAWTCAAWVKMADTGSNQALVTGLHNGVYLQYGTSDKARVYLDASPAHYCDSTDLTTSLYDNAWHHVVFVFDNVNSIVKIYVDAVDKSDTPVGSSNVDANAETWEIGDTSQCSIADFRFYNTPLSTTDVVELYQSSAQVDNNGNFWC